MDENKPTHKVLEYLSDGAGVYDDPVFVGTLKECQDWKEKNNRMLSSMCSVYVIRRIDQKY